MAEETTVPQETYVELLAALIHGLNAAQLGENEQVVAALDRLKAHANDAVEFLFGRAVGLMMFIDAVLGDLEDGGLGFEEQVEALAEELRAIERGDLTVAELMEDDDEVFGVLDADARDRSRRDHPSMGDDDWPDWLRSL